MLLARLTMEAIPLLMLIFGFIFAMSIVSNRAKERRERLRILEEQLRAGNLDGISKQRIVDELSGRAPSVAPAASGSGTSRPFGGPARLVFAIGWLMIFLGLALLMAGGRDEEEAGTILAPLGFALVTLPIAMRELESDRRRRKA